MREQSTIAYPMAKDPGGQWINIDSVVKGLQYYCPECQSEMIPKLGQVRKHHFAHHPGYSGVCTGESAYHNLAKHLLAYHFDTHKAISFTTGCPMCHEEVNCSGTVELVEVEKGESQVRPDLTLTLKSGFKIYCEIVYKNPVRDKLEFYQKHRSRLLLWRVPGNIVEVPEIQHYYWDEIPAPEAGQLLPEDYNLMLIADIDLAGHRCQPYGLAYVSKWKCWNCHKETNIALLSQCFPNLSSTKDPQLSLCERVIGIGDFLKPVEGLFIPHYFWANLNRQHGTKLTPNYCSQADNYLTNRCIHCNADQNVVNQSALALYKPERVKVNFYLTDEEQIKLADKYQRLVA